MIKWNCILSFYSAQYVGLSESIDYLKNIPGTNFHSKSAKRALVFRRTNFYLSHLSIEIISTTVQLKEYFQEKSKKFNEIPITTASTVDCKNITSSYDCSLKTYLALFKMMKIEVKYGIR